MKASDIQAGQTYWWTGRGPFMSVSKVLVEVSNFPHGKPALVFKSDGVTYDVRSEDLHESKEDAKAELERQIQVRITTQENQIATLKALEITFEGDSQ